MRAGPSMSSKVSPGMKRDTARRMNGARVPCSRSQVLSDDLQDQLRAMLTAPDCRRSAAACEGARAGPAPATPTSPARRRRSSRSPPPTTEAPARTAPRWPRSRTRPISFDMLTNRCFTADTRPRKRVGRDHLLQRQADDDADVVADAGHEQAQQREARACRDSPKPIIARPKPATAPSSTRPGRSHAASRVVMSAIVSAPAAGAARSQPRPAGPDLQDVLREDRQQRDRAAEQHREQVQRDGREEHGASRHEPQPGQHAAVATAGPGRRRLRHAPAAAARTWPRPSAATANAAAAPPVAAMMNAAGRRADDRRQLHGRGHPRVQVREHRRRQQLRQDGVHGGRAERAADPDASDQRVGERHRGRSPRRRTARPAAASARPPCASMPTRRRGKRSAA